MIFAPKHIFQFSYEVENLDSVPAGKSSARPANSCRRFCSLTNSGKSTAAKDGFRVKCQKQSMVVARCCTSALAAPRGLTFWPFPFRFSGLDSARKWFPLWFNLPPLSASQPGKCTPKDWDSSHYKSPYWADLADCVFGQLPIGDFNVNLILKCLQSVWTVLIYMNVKPSVSVAQHPQTSLVLPSTAIQSARDQRYASEQLLKDRRLNRPSRATPRTFLV